jgi:hypothetical protein
MILKLSNNRIVNWDNVIGIMTRNENVKIMHLDSKEYAITKHKGDHDYTDYPFMIEIETDFNRTSIFRTSDAEEMQETYDAILARIVTDLSNKKAMCDISDLIKTHDLWNTYIDYSEYTKLEKEYHKRWIDMQEVRADG